MEITDDAHARINLFIAPGTNLIEKYVEITATQGASACPSQYGALTSSENITMHGMTFLHEIGSGIAAGNIYDWESYSTAKNDVCVNLTFTLHSGEIGNYMTPPAEFNRVEEAKIFPMVFSTFVWVTP